MSTHAPRPAHKRGLCNVARIYTPSSPSLPPILLPLQTVHHNSPSTRPSYPHPLAEYSALLSHSPTSHPSSTLYLRSHHHSHKSSCGLYKLRRVPQNLLLRPPHVPGPAAAASTAYLNLLLWPSTNGGICPDVSGTYRKIPYNVSIDHYKERIPLGLSRIVCGQCKWTEG